MRGLPGAVAATADSSPALCSRISRKPQGQAPDFDEVAIMVIAAMPRVMGGLAPIHPESPGNVKIN